jgi:hypothetical protein
LPAGLEPPVGNMEQISKVAIVFLLGAFAILSLVVAAGGHGDLQYWGGLGFFVLCVLLTFYAVHDLTATPHNSSDRGH